MNATPTAPTNAARERLAFIMSRLTPKDLDRMVDKVAFQTEAALKEATPKRWFGQVRNGWQTKKTGPQERLIINNATAQNGAKIILFLEEGTANNGAGFILPKKAKKLYVPLTKRATAGWHEGLKYGVDYVLKDKVRGIKGRGIVAAERVKAKERLKNGMKELVTAVLSREGMISAKV